MGLNILQSYQCLQVIYHKVTKTVILVYTLVVDADYPEYLQRFTKFS